MIPTPTSPVRLPLPHRRERAAVRSGQARDPRRFAALYRAEHQAIFRFCRSLVHHEEDARDVLQTTFAKAFAALATEERDFELRPWLFRIAHNEAISLLRRRRETVDLDELALPARDALGDQLQQREDLRMLRRDLATLPERQRGALVLRELSGLSHDEIAVVLETTPAAAKQVVFEARAALHALREGRAMPCEDLRRTLSDGDRRTLRSRKVQAHLQACAGCRDFQEMLAARPAALAALAPPLPAAAAAALLGELLGGSQAAAASAGSAATAATGAGTTAAAQAGGGLLTGLAAKAAVVTVLAATAGGGALVAGAAPGGGTGPGDRPAVTTPHDAPPRTAATGATPSTRGSAARPPQATPPSTGERQGTHPRSRAGAAADGPRHADSPAAGRPEPGTRADRGTSGAERRDAAQQRVSPVLRQGGRTDRAAGTPVPATSRPVRPTAPAPATPVPAPARPAPSVDSTPAPPPPAPSPPAAAPDTSGAPSSPVLPK